MSLQRMDVSTPIRFRNLGDRFLIHFFMINGLSRILSLHTIRRFFLQISSHVSGENVGMICYICSLKSQHQTLTFLEG